MENEQTTVEVSRHLKVGVRAIIAAVGYVAATLLLGWNFFPCLLILLMLVSLLMGGIAVFCGLFLKANRQGTRLWKHIGVLLTILVLSFLLTVGPGNYIRLLDLRARLTVALTGGQEELQAWAVALLDEPRDPNSPDVWRERGVPRERWSKQVRRLRPGAVQIEPAFENGGEAVALCYGGGFFHWYIVVGRSGSRPDPSCNQPNSDIFWYHWADGIYDRQEW